MTLDLDRLASATTPLDEALRLFAHARTTPDEGRAIDALLARESYAPLPEPLLVAVAAALVDRGEVAAAARALSRAASNEALMLAAELLAQRDDLASAIAKVERVLSRDIDWPGARERHARWRGALGIAIPRGGTDTTATLATAEPDAPFRLLREVGRGGAAAVYEAEDRELGRPIALKVYHRSESDRAQLLHEARVAVSLSGRGIVRVFDVDPDRGWIAMEWVKLGAMRSHVRSRDVRALLPVARWALPLAAALARVHAAGWVHHDVKPANVLLRAPDDPLLSDFGTARRAGEPSPPGSLGYVSPERLAGRASDPRDDVYGFGKVLKDALDATGHADEWASIAAACTGSDEARPKDGRELIDVIGARERPRQRPR